MLVGTLVSHYGLIYIFLIPIVLTIFSCVFKYPYILLVKCLVKYFALFKLGLLIN